MAAKLAITDLISLPNSAVRIPRIGFGVYEAHGQKCVDACLAALKAGYRHIDTAQYYGNETEVGEAVRQSGIKRSDIFITTKILSGGGSPEKTYQKALDSVRKIDGEDGSVDLFLIHSASGGAKGRRELYQALERLLEEGKTKSIGVSNWGIGHIEELKGVAKIYPPHVNQIELHPFTQQREIVDFCHEHGIVVEAYCPLVRNQKVNDPTLKAIAASHGKTVAQVLLRYCLQKNWVPLPKSTTPSRIAENADVYDFELTAMELSKMDALDEGPKGAIVHAVNNKL